MKLKKGDKAPQFSLKDVSDKIISLEKYRGKKTMISFYRYAGCPFCNFRMNEIKQNYPDLKSNGLEMITFWQSDTAEILKDIKHEDIVFPLLPDPSKTIYKKYGVENSWLSIFKMILTPKRFINTISSKYMSLKVKGDVNLVPADFLINPDLTIHTAYYGKNIGDHLPIELIEEFLQE